MGMNRIFCPSCGWSTKPNYSILRCIMEKEWAHRFGHLENGYDAHDSAFGKMCPKCGRQTMEEYRWFSDDEIRQLGRKTT